jgi:hypothetical protein
MRTYGTTLWSYTPEDAGNFTFRLPYMEVWLLISDEVNHGKENQNQIILCISFYNKVT